MTGFTLGHLRNIEPQGPNPIFRYLTLNFFFASALMINYNVNSEISTGLYRAQNNFLIYFFSFPVIIEKVIGD